MSSKLKDRLKRIKQIGLPEADEKSSGKSRAPAKEKDMVFPGWEKAGYQTLKRTIIRETGFESVTLQVNFLPSLAIIIPDLHLYGTDEDKNSMRPAGFKNLIFFDLETTGLGGAGCLAFLASFGRFIEGGLEINQYLLLDFPGENDFINEIKKEFSNPEPKSPALIVSYNGKAFDSQIINSRCLMKGIKPPQYYHADLLHPCRRLWKRVLPDCSQGTLEENLFGIDRSDDTPGSFAPDIWFAFLKNGKTDDLFGICDHNIRDIYGLARLFIALTEVSSSPLKMAKRFRADTEALALLWRETIRRRHEYLSREDEITVAALMETAAVENYPRVLRLLSMEAEWKENNYPAALDYAERILRNKNILPKQREDAERRRERLKKKISVWANKPG